MKKPDLSLEKPLWQKNYVVIGIDEVGRGALAGPLTVGAVCFKPNWMNDDYKKIQKLGINDSKVLSAQKRSELSPIIKEYALAVATASCTVSEIDTKGLTKVTCELFNTVVQNCISLLSKESKIFVLVDGKICPPIQNLHKDMIQTVINGDAKSISIAGASIIAKVDRDAQMTKLSQKYPKYRWELNKGYGTQIHIAALRTYGSTILHRKKFINGIL